MLGVQFSCSLHAVCMQLLCSVLLAVCLLFAYIFLQWLCMYYACRCACSLHTVCLLCASCCLLVYFSTKRVSDEQTLSAQTLGMTCFRLDHSVNVAWLSDLSIGHDQTNADNGLGEGDCHLAACWQLDDSWVWETVNLGLAGIGDDYRLKPWQVDDLETHRTGHKGRCAEGDEGATQTGPPKPGHPNGGDVSRLFWETMDDDEPPKYKETMDDDDAPKHKIPRRIPRRYSKGLDVNARSASQETSHPQSSTT